jgi:hypothetical protein
MSKKTSRAARAVQNQRTVRDPDKKKIEGARPLVSSLSSSALIEGEIETFPSAAHESEAIQEESSRITPLTPASPNRSRGPLPNRRFTGIRQPAISREEEYNFVRSDLRTVFILTVLMLIALVALTVIIGR